MNRRRSSSSRRAASVNKVAPMSSAQWYYTGGEMEGSKTVQQLLRPPDTCTFVVQGYLLGLQNPAEKLFAIVRHEGSDEHALFMFTVDDMESPPQLVLDKFCAIRGSFQAQIKAIRGGRCNVLLDDGSGSSIMIQLLYSTSITALFISNLNQALQQFAYSPSVNSPSAFHWLHGYEACRTGWDRFTKPSSNSRIQRSDSPAPLIEFGRDGRENGGEGERHMRVSLPESWPWSHIITPNSDGTTEVAKCESLLQDFDPLHQPDAHRQLPDQLPDRGQPRSQSQPQYQLRTQFQEQEQPVAIAVTDTAPEDDLCRLPKPFRASDPPPPTVGGFDDDFNPLPLPTTTPSPSLSDPGTASEPTDLRHCTSDSNLLKLDNRYQTRSYNKMETRSEEDLTLVDTQGHGNRHCIATTNQEGCALERSGSDYCLIDVRMASPDIDVGQPLNDADTDAKGDSLKTDLPMNKHLTKVTQDGGRPYSSVDIPNSSDEEDALDYKSRRARSTDTSPNVHDFRRARTDFPRKHFDFLAPSGSKPGVSKVIFNSPELTRRRRARSRDRAGSRAAATLSRNQWVSRYRPGVPIPTESARESIMQAELRHREKEFCTSRELRIFCGTWNVNGRHAPSSLEGFLLEYEVEGEELPPPAPDIFAVAFQELDLSTQALMGQESTREEYWISAVEQTIGIVGKYHKLCSMRLVGMLLLLFIKEGLQEYVTDVMADMVPTGMAGLFGNKGAVAIHFNLFHSSLCFVNSHLPAHMEEIERRNQDYHIIQNKMVFDRGIDYAYGIMDHDMVFWLGDLNYRIQTTAEMTPDIIKSYADNYQISRLLKYDQLMQEVAKGNVFMFFTEGDIDFKPTYKFDVNSDEWDTSEKARPPAWCDRILMHGKGLKLRAYRSHPKLKISDHKPVSAIYDAMVCVVSPDKEKEVLEQITWRLDKLENDTLPQVDLSTTEFQFQDVKFMTPQSKRLVVTNTGQRPVHISFIPKLDEKAYCQPWLEVKPSSAVIQPLEDVTMHVTVLVNEDTVLALSKADHKLEDILILHLEKGKDFFITILGNYLLSCFGSSLETLIHLHTYIREVPVARLLDLTQSGLTTSWDETIATDAPDEPKPAPPALDIPKELYQMVDYINRKGLETEGLFAEGGRQGELEDIRDHLDTGGPRMPGTVNSVAAGLLLFLGALAEPVVPVSLHQKAMDCCNNATLCKQVLMQMPKVHRRTLAFLITLMKNLLEHSEVNGLEAKVLATIFGDAILRHTSEDRKTKSKKQLASMNRKKATFIYQFLVNDLIVSYK